MAEETVTVPLDKASVAPLVRGSRLDAIDIFRGLSILEVVLHHVLGFSIRQVEGGSNLHLLLVVLNRTLHFAVPAFLFMTAVVFTRAAVAKPFHARRFYGGRFKKSLMPYVIWTVLYGVYKTVVFGGDLLDWERWLFWLQYGKGYYHLYFLLIALQFHALFPLFVPFWKRHRRHFGWVTLLAFASQAGVYLLNKETALVDFRFPATMVWWYIPSLALGMYFGSRYREFESVWRNHRLLIFALAAVGYGFYLPQGVNSLLGLPVNNYQYNAAYWLFTTTFALMLFGLAHSFSRGPRGFRKTLAFLGKHSLQIYLLHPLVLDVFKRFDPPGSTGGFLLFLGGCVAMCLLVPLGISHGLRNSRWSVWLFGR